MAKQEIEPSGNLRKFTYQDRLTYALTFFAIAMAFALSKTGCSDSPSPNSDKNQALIVQEANFSEQEKIIDDALNYLRNSKNELLQSISQTIDLTKDPHLLGLQIISTASLFFEEDSHGRSVYIKTTKDPHKNYILVDPDFLAINEITTEELAIILAQKAATIAIIATEKYAPESPLAISIDQAEWLTITRYALKPLASTGQLQSPRLKALLNGHENEPLAPWLASLPPGGFNALIKR